MTSPEEPWYFDLRRGIPVPASERGPSDDVLGPYPSRAEALNWRSRVDERNEEWDDADEAWEEGDEESSD